MVRRVEISKLAARQLRKLPRQIVDNLAILVAAVEQGGLEEVRKVRGYHDEPLKGRPGRPAGDPPEPQLPSHLRDQAGHGKVRLRGGSKQAGVLMEVPPMRKAKEKKSDAMKLLEKISCAPLTLGRAIESIRRGEELSQDECAKKLGISKSHLCDVEKGRKTVSPERAARWARTLGCPESVLVRLAIQGELDAAGLRYRVEIKAA